MSFRYVEKWLEIVPEPLIYGPTASCSPIGRIRRPLIGASRTEFDAGIVRSPDGRPAPAGRRAERTLITLNKTQMKSLKLLCITGFKRFFIEIQVLSPNYYLE
jgi:hypothetical protein